jgi:CBS domain-containing protein
MTDTVKVDLHCHSTHSDGEWSPDKIAQVCAATGVKYASLTDHNTLDGLDAFESACDRNGIGFVSGLELTARYGSKETHLLCYGFDKEESSLRETVFAIKESLLPNRTIQSVAEPKELENLIRTIHEAGGVVILAHPFVTEPDRQKLESLIAVLVEHGLDGIEVYHPQSTSEQQEILHALAKQFQCVSTGGTDHHGFSGSTGPEVGVDIPVNEWRTFRDCLLKQRKKTRQKTSAQAVNTKGDPSPASPTNKTRLFIWMIAPALAAVLLFIIAMFGIFLPGYEKGLMDQKREMIRELTNTVWSMLDEADNKIRLGQISESDARAQVIERTRALKYGKEGKDYFWLQDLTPRMIMHPYRSDLDGQDLSEFKDPRGVYIFRVFADIGRTDGEGYVDYVWQWKDDPSRLEAKESYIRLFKPWEWVIGTGLYMHDVRKEIKALQMRIVSAMLVIIAVLILLLLTMLRGGLKTERMKLLAERRLRESNERYSSLVHAATEGVLIVRNNRCAYANPIFLQFGGCDSEELGLLDWKELFPSISTQEFSSLRTDLGNYTDTFLRRRDGADLPCRMALKGISENHPGNFVILVRKSEASSAPSLPDSNGLLNRLLNLPSAVAEDVSRKIAQATTTAQVITLCERTSEMVRSMLESGASPTAITMMISSITDAATIKFIELAQANLGPAPVRFAFVALGSQGRQEQTLFTDQDNAIIYESTGSGIDSQAKYFAALSGEVCGNLEKSGFRNCKSDVMATNPKWCQPLGVWKGYITDWITKAEENEITQFNIVYDFRCIVDDTGMIQQSLREHIQEQIIKAPRFLTQVANNALLFKSPTRLFGNIVTVGGSKEKTGQLDLKAVMIPVVSFTRLYSIQKGISFPTTQERLSALSDQGVLLPSQFHDILTVFEALTRLRLRYQILTIQKGSEPDNFIDPSLLGHVDEAVLKECFNEIDMIQERIRRDFLGGETSL